MSEVKVPDDIVEITKRIRDSSKMDGAIWTADEFQERYNEGLPEGLTPELCAAKAKYDSKFIAATGRAFALDSVDAMKKDKHLQETQFSGHIGKDTIGAVFRRTYEKSKGIPKDGEKRETEMAYGQLNMSYKKFGSAGSRGEMKKVRDEAAEYARKMLAK